MRFKITFLPKLLGVLLVPVLFAATASAQSTGLGITPHREVTVPPGKSADSKLYVSNLNTKRPIKITFSVLDFRAADETGTPSVELNKDAPNTPWSLKPFIKLPDSIELGPGEGKYVPFTVQVPLGQGPGSYYSAVRYNTEPTDKSGVTINASAASLVFVTVPGKATEQLNFKKFGAYSIKENQQKGHFQSLFMSEQPKVLAYLVENAGNVAEKPSGTVEITNTFGKRVKVIKNVNPNSGLALIGQTRRIDMCINSEQKAVTANGLKTVVESCATPDLGPGRYTLHLNLFYGQNGSASQQINQTATIWYLPVWFIVETLAALAILAFVIYMLRNQIARPFKKLKPSKSNR